MPQAFFPAMGGLNLGEEEKNAPALCQWVFPPKQTVQLHSGSNEVCDRRCDGGLGAAFPVCSAETTDPAGRGHNHGQILFQEIPTVVGASKYEQRTTEAPSYISIVTAEEIKRYGYRTLADIVASVAGFYPDYDRSYHYVGLRGFSLPGITTPACWCCSTGIG